MTVRRTHSGTKVSSVVSSSGVQQHRIAGNRRSTDMRVYPTSSPPPPHSTPASFAASPAATSSSSSSSSSSSYSASQHGPRPGYGRHDDHTSEPPRPSYSVSSYSQMDRPLYSSAPSYETQAPLSPSSFAAGPPASPVVSTYASGDPSAVSTYATDAPFGGPDQYGTAPLQRRHGPGGAP